MSVHQLYENVENIIIDIIGAYIIRVKFRLANDSSFISLRHMQHNNILSSCLFL